MHSPHMCTCVVILFCQYKKLPQSLYHTILGTNLHLSIEYVIMYHLVWADQREKQGYKCDVSLKGGIQIICTLENDATLYIDTTKLQLIVGLNLLIILSLTLNLVTKCFLTREPLLIMGLKLLMIFSL